MHSTVGDLYLCPIFIYALSTPLLGIFIYRLMHSTVGDLYLRLMHSTVGDLYLPPNALHCWGSLFTP